MPSFMTLGKPSWKRCKNKPTWLASDGIGSMTLCDECKKVCEKHRPDTTYVKIAQPISLDACLNWLALLPSITPEDDRVFAAITGYLQQLRVYNQVPAATQGRAGSAD